MMQSAYLNNPWTNSPNDHSNAFLIVSDTTLDPHLDPAGRELGGCLAKSDKGGSITNRLVNDRTEEKVNKLKPDLDR